MVRLVFLMLIATAAHAQPARFEQSALDYFAQNILPDQYKRSKTVEFNRKTETKFTYLGHIRFCFKIEIRLEEQLRTVSQPHNDEQHALNLKKKHLKVVKVKPDSHRLKLYVSKSTPLGKHNYVLIDVYKKNNFINHYLFEMEADGKMVRWCNAEEII